MDNQIFDDDLAVFQDAVRGPAMWTDPALYSAVFLSGPLGDELVLAGFRDAFFLRKCRVV
jgi:hypothetical protein